MESLWLVDSFMFFLFFCLIFAFIILANSDSLVAIR